MPPVVVLPDEAWGLGVGAGVGDGGASLAKVVYLMLGLGVGLGLSVSKFDGWGIKLGGVLSSMFLESAEGRGKYLLF